MVYCKVCPLTRSMYLELSEFLVIGEKKNKEVAPVQNITRMVTKSRIDTNSAALQAATKFGNDL